MKKNPYDILGVNKTATDKEIKSAYRKLAKKYHPDLNPGDAEAEKQFKEVSVAYELLHNKEKRAAYDSGEVDMDGNPQGQQQQYYKDFAEGPQGQRYYSSTGGDFNQEDIENIFGSFFTGGVGGRNAGFKAQPSDAYYKTEINFMEAAKGTKKRITMPDGKVIDLSIPEGIEDGKQLRLKGKGSPGNVSSPAGDAYIEVHVKPHALFTRKGKDIYTEIPVGIHESILGNKIQIPTIHGKVEMAIPKGASTGTKLRLKGKGIKNGDQYAILKIVMPDKIDNDLISLIEKWTNTHGYNPRKHKEFTS